MANKFFDHRALIEPREEETTGHGKYVSKYLVSHFEKVANLEEDLLRIPTAGETFFLQSEGSFNAFSFVVLIARRFPIKELHASTYSLSRRVVDALIEMHDKGMIEQLTLLVNDGILSRSPVTMDNLRAMASTRPNLKVLLAWVHAKVCLMRAGSFYFCVEGSGNWSDNAQYEQYIMTHDKGVYDFRMKLFTESKIKKY